MIMMMMMTVVVVVVVVMMIVMMVVMMTGGAMMMVMMMENIYFVFRDGMVKMQDVYSSNAKMGNAASLAKQLEENGQQLDHLRQELNKYEVRFSSRTPLLIIQIDF